MAITPLFIFLKTALAELVEINTVLEFFLSENNINFTPFTNNSKTNQILKWLKTDILRLFHFRK